MAEYQLVDEENLRVANRGWNAERQRWQRRGPSLPAESGEARRPVRVTFFWPFFGSYRIIALDPEYQWALVAGGDRSWLWILARTPTLDGETRDRLVEQARALEFPVDELIWVEHRQRGSDLLTEQASAESVGVEPVVK